MKDLATPKVSVIVPNYNYARYLDQRLQSILRQTYQDFEIIILDDASTDDSKAVIDKYRKDPHISAICINQHNSGIPFAQWERGIDMSRGEFIWIAEADDFAEETFLEKCMKAYALFPKTVICQAGALLVNEQGQPMDDTMDKWRQTSKPAISFNGKSYIRRFLRWSNRLYNASGIVFRKSALKNVDFEEVKTYRVCGDWLFWSILAEQGDVTIIKQKLNRFRRSSNSASARVPADENYRIMRNFLSRGIFHHFTLTYALAIATNIRCARKNKTATEQKRLFKEWDVSFPSIYYNYMMFVRLIDNVKRGSIYYEHKRI